MNKKIKVCFVSIFSYPLFNPDSKEIFGGAETQVSLISKKLAEDKDYDVNVVVGDFGQEKKEKYDGVSVWSAYRRGRDFKNIIQAPVQLYKKIKEINPDVVISRAAGVETGIAGVYAKLNKKKFIYSIASDGDFFEYKKKFSGKIFYIGFKLADYYIAQNKFQYEKIKAKGQIIKNSFAVKGKKEKKEKNHILWVGRGSAVKQPEMFLAIASKFPKEKFVMIMPSKDKKIKEKIKKEAEKINNLEFIESVPFDKIGDYYERAKIFVSTSSFEGFPNTFIQAGIARTALLSYKVDPDGFIMKNNCGTVCGGDFNLMISSLRNMLESKEWREHGENNYDYVLRSHDIKKNIVKWKELINKYE